MKYALKLAGVSKTYNGRRKQNKKKALNALSLKIPTGCIFGLLGPNGAGKSTLINIVAGLTNKSSGSVSIWGYDQDQNPEQSRSFLGVVPQELNLDPFLSPRQALEIQAGLFGVPRHQRQTLKILGKVGLMDVKDSYARSLSGGMRRRLLMAKALVHSPPVLILDEPTAGVDIELREMLWDYVLELQASGTTIILTTHYLEEAQKVCDQIGILNKGTLVEYGATTTLLNKIKSKILIIHPHEKIMQIPEFPSAVIPTIQVDGSLELSFDKSQISTEELIDLCRNGDISIRDIATCDPALEDVFRLATKD
ncbi:MAG: ABC transporter ATP-binding protein [Paracoccaceae bacterium]|nr:ABC transporter ATP-binding protein [Paracoccaceae bacterium]